MIDQQKPCLVQAKQGFSVSYRERFLYSKYDPQKNIINLINNLEVLEGTIFLIFSPCLFYGLEDLKNKLKNNCLIFACEKDELLYNFSKENSASNKNEIPFLNGAELLKLPEKINELCKSGKYKRIVRIDFSTGTQFYQEFYNKLEESCKNIIQTFWKNRVTLIKFGRKYCSNLFKNLKLLPETTPIEAYFKSIKKPIIVFGAGESIDYYFEKNSDLDFSDFFILCADTALRPLLDRKIKVDGVFIEEAQSVILKAFIGCNAEKNDFHIFAGLSSASQLSNTFPQKNISYFSTEFTDLHIFQTLKNNNCLPPQNPPFGSVGLTSVYYALKFRKNENIPVYVCGLDFSFSVGKTHAKSTLANILRLQSSTRINNIQNIASSFSYGNSYESGKDNKKIISTPTLLSYAQSFNAFFSSEKNLFDCSEKGIKLQIEQKFPESLSPEKTNEKIIKASGTESFSQKNDYSKINKIIQNEKNELSELLNLLTKKSELSEEELKNKIEKLAAEKEYLYLYFPDGYCFSYNQSFLNRLRTQIDFFLKIM